MTRWIAVVLVGPLVFTAPAEAAMTSERDRRAYGGAGKRPPCEKRVDGVLREIGIGAHGLDNVSCRKAKRVMKRYILRKDLPRGWECRSIPQLGKCFYYDPPTNPELSANFNFSPAQRA
jgi:hypothetical protein